MPITNTTPGYRLAVKNAARAWSPSPTISHLIYEVKRATPTQVIAGNMHDATREIRVRISDGRIIDNRPVCDFAIDITPEIMAQHETEVATYRRWNAAYKRLNAVEDAITKRKLTIEQMEAIATAYESTLPTEPEIAP